MSKSESTRDSRHAGDPRSGSRASQPLGGSVDTPAPSSRQLLTIDQLSEWLQVPKQTVYKWRTCGNGPRGLRIGKHVRFEKAEVERWLSDQLES
jgi:excisionase family DNA binding protein